MEKDEIQSLPYNIKKSNSRCYKELSVKNNFKL